METAKPSWARTGQHTVVKSVHPSPLSASRPRRWPWHPHRRSL
jgi:uracil DNA glycosylase